jgi:peroxiredoxin
MAQSPAGPLNQLISVAPDFTLPNATGADITLSELSAQQPVVLVFYRAYW